MNDANPLQAFAAATLGEISVSLHALLQRTHMRGELVPWLRRAATEALLLEHARALGLRVDDVELQKAADLFRRRNQLLSSAATQAWFAERQVTADDFEAMLECDLLLEKLRERVAGAEQVAQHFAAHPVDYDRLQLRRLVVAREDLAREIVTQVQEEGADFAALAAQHSLPAGRRAAGAAIIFFRCQVEPPLLRDALKDAKAGDIVGPVAAGEGFHLALIEQADVAVLDAATTALIARRLYGEWLATKMAATPFAAPLLEFLG